MEATGFVAGIAVGGARRSARTCATCTASADVVVVGGGIGGLASAVAIRKATNRSVVVLERTDASAEIGGVSLSLWPNAWSALDAIDEELAGQLREGKMRIERAKILTSEGTTLNSWEFDDVWRGFELRAVPRSELISGLRDLALKLGVEVQYGAEVASVDGSCSTVNFASGDSLQANVIVGADGVRSKVRAALLEDGSPKLWPIVAYRGVSDVAEDAEPVALQVWSTKNDVRFGSLPLSSRKAYWFVTASGTPPSKPEVTDNTEALRLVAGFSGGAEGLVAGTSEVLCNSLVDRSPAYPWGRENLTLLGDSAHPMLPNLGQGAAMALEDAVAIAAALKTAGGDRAASSRALRKYEKSRVVRSSQIQLRSRFASFVVHYDSPVPRFLVSKFFNPKLVLSFCKFDAPIKL